MHHAIVVTAAVLQWARYIQVDEMVRMRDVAPGPNMYTGNEVLPGMDGVQYTYSYSVDAEGRDTLVRVTVPPHARSSWQSRIERRNSTTAD